MPRTRSAVRALMALVGVVAVPFGVFAVTSRLDGEAARAVPLLAWPLLALAVVFAINARRVPAPPPQADGEALSSESHPGPGGWH